jgi:hypothetical protein
MQPYIMFVGWYLELPPASRECVLEKWDRFLLDINLCHVCQSLNTFFQVYLNRIFGFIGCSAPKRRFAVYAAVAFGINHRRDMSFHKFCMLKCTNVH